MSGSLISASNLLTPCSDVLHDHGGSDRNKIHSKDPSIINNLHHSRINTGAANLLFTFANAKLTADKC